MNCKRLLTIIVMTAILLLSGLSPTITKAESELRVHLGVSPLSVASGNTVTISWWIEGVHVEHLVEVQFYVLDPIGNKVIHESYGWGGVGSQSLPIVRFWQVPPNATPGTYQCGVEADSGMSEPFIYHGAATVSFNVVAEAGKIEPPLGPGPAPGPGPAHGDTQDIIPPTVNIAHYPPSPSCLDQINFTAEAWDPSGIQRIGIWVNDRMVSECLTSRCTCAGGPYKEGDVLTYYARALDTAGNAGMSASHRITIGGVPDITPPGINITHAPEHPCLLDRVTFTATAQDPSGIQQIEIYVNDSQVGECPSDRCSYWEDPYPEGTVVTYAARARDTAGNAIMSGTNSFTVRDICGCVTLPMQFIWTNWQRNNWLTPVKDQSPGLTRCGSCWAFATVGAMEAIHKIEQNSNVNIDLSEQDLVSNCYRGGNCDGLPGTTEALQQTFEWIKRNGVCDEACHPYTAQNSPCMRCSNPWPGLHEIDDYRLVANNVGARQRALLCHGPLISCGRGHCVVIVGWDNYRNCWRIKNSWGVFWGDWGYGWIPYTDNWTDYVFWVEGIR